MDHCGQYSKQLLATKAGLIASPTGATCMRSSLVGAAFQSSVYATHQLSWRVVSEAQLQRVTGGEDVSGVYSAAAHMTLGPLWRSDGAEEVGGGEGRVWSRTATPSTFFKKKDPLHTENESPHYGVSAR